MSATRQCAAALALLATCCLCFAAATPDTYKSGGPYVPTPQIVVDEMLRLAKVSARDHVIDLGSGDGVIVLTAARQFKASGVGIEIDPELVQMSNATASMSGVADRVRFLQQDVFKADLSKASVLTLYLLPGMMLSLREKIFTELKPGTRVVSHDYHLGDWRADDQMSFDVPEKEKVNGVPKATLYLWHIPARVAGRWQVRAPGGETYDVAFRQRFNELEATATIAGRPVRALQPTLRGEEISFGLPDGKGTLRYSGRVKDGAMEGAVEGGAGVAQRWSATRTSSAKVILE